MPEKVVVIPTYNERGNIERLLPELLQADPEVEVVIVDDNSPDGTADADIRLEVAMTVDSGIGVIRHAQAGYDSAKDVANGKGKLTKEGIKVPLWWQPADKVTFGPDGSDKL